jgi:HEAT repeat protein
VPRATFPHSVISLLLVGLIAACVAEAPPTHPDALIPPLVELLNDPNPEVRQTAAMALGKIARPHAAPALVEKLRDPDPVVRRESAWALGNLGDEVTDQAGVALVKRLGDPSDEVKAAAAQALGGMRATPDLVERLTETLRRGDVPTKRATIQALALLEAPASYQALVEALRDDDARVRQGAIAALGELGDARALPLIRDRLLHDRDVGVRSEAAFRLGKFGDATVVSALKSAAAHHGNAEVRRWASWAGAQLSGRGGSDSGP